MIRCLSLLAHGGIILSLLFFVFEILDWYNPVHEFFGSEDFHRFDDSLLPAHLGAVGLGTPYPLAEIPREETLPFHQTPACPSQGAGQTAGTVTRTVGQVLLYGKILTPIFPKDNFFLNRSQAMGEETPEGLQQTRGVHGRTPLVLVYAFVGL